MGVIRSAEAFGKVWALIRPPWPHTFDGTPDDVRALDYLHYEGIPFPAGIEGAALVCGEVLRRAARLQWVISHRGDWFVATAADAWPAIAICPLVRLNELEFAATPQFGRHALFLSRAALDCLPFASPVSEPDLRRLAACDEDFIHDLERTLEKLRRTGPAA